MTSSVGESEILTSAELEARKRRERILQLKRKAQNKTDDQIEVPKDTREEPPSLGNTLTESKDSDDVDNDSEGVVDRTNADKSDSEELDMSKLASRKVDWDLKRGIEKSLAILQDQTNEVIAEIVQESMGSDEEDE